MQRLDAYLREAREGAFVYGERDCCQFIAGAVLAMTGVDHRDKFPNYASREEAQAILAERGGLAGLITYALGEPVHVARMNRGDVCLAQGADGALCAAICLGSALVSYGESQLVYPPREQARVAWPVL